jgi:hypothetical protein
VRGYGDHRVRRDDDWRRRGLLGAGELIAMAMTKTEQRDAMREFCRRCIQAAWDDALDAADVQDWANELGLTYTDKATKADIQDYSFDGDVGDPIYRLERWLEKPSPVDSLPYR